MRTESRIASESGELRAENGKPGTESTGCTVEKVCGGVGGWRMTARIERRAGKNGWEEGKRAGR
jgi:hypothetical protein